MVLLAWVAPEFDAVKHAVNLLDDSQLLVVTRGSPEHMDLAEARTGRIRTDYVAQGKEKLAEVAKKFGMGSHDLARINRISYDTVLAKGQTVIVYQVADPNRSKRADEQWKKTPRSRRGKVAGARADRTASTNLPDDPQDASPDDDDPAATAAPGEPDARPDARPTSKADAKPASRLDAKPTTKRDSTTADSSKDGGPVTNPAQVH